MSFFKHGYSQWVWLLGAQGQPWQPPWIQGGGTIYAGLGEATGDPDTRKSLETRLEVSCRQLLRELQAASLGQPPR